MSSLDLERDEPDEYLPPVPPAPAQHLEKPLQRLARMQRQQAELRVRLSRTIDADERIRLGRLIGHRATGIAYQRREVMRLGK